jgi:DNA-binding FadR family transcriptional regulator
MELQPVERTSASGAVFEQLLGELMGGRVEPGEALPAERSLTESLSVNRQAVREALQRLAQAGLVRIRQGEPTRALDYRRSAGLDLLPRLLFHADGAVDIATARSIVEMRASVGPDAARLAALRAPAGTSAKLRSILTAMEAAKDDLDELAAADLRFWDEVIDAADNIAYRLAYNSLRGTYEPLSAVLSPVLAEELSDFEDHHAIVEAVEAADERAAEAAARRLLSKGTAAMSRLFVSLAEGRQR